MCSLGLLKCMPLLRIVFLRCIHIGSERIHFTAVVFHYVRVPQCFCLFYHDCWCADGEPLGVCFLCVCHDKHTSMSTLLLVSWSRCSRSSRERIQEWNCCVLNSVELKQLYKNSKFFSKLFVTIYPPKSSIKYSSYACWFHFHLILRYLISHIIKNNSQSILKPSLQESM